MTGTRIVPYDYDVVIRRINRGAAALREVVDVVDSCCAHLRVDEPFTEHAGYTPGWHTTGRLYGRGFRFARYTRVHIELTAWATYATELRISPVTRGLPAWGKRRQQRYFDAARTAADAIVHALDLAVVQHQVATSRAFTVIPPVTRSGRQLPTKKL